MNRSAASGDRRRLGIHDVIQLGNDLSLNCAADCFAIDRELRKRNRSGTMAATPQKPANSYEAIPYARNPLQEMSSRPVYQLFRAIALERLLIAYKAGENLERGQSRPLSSFCATALHYTGAGKPSLHTPELPDS
ncbi:MAG: hypothetical protein JNK74_06270 [Candidatus Hydrogenedentes bacterium]|nr:hypothetical protein [Candidatus Hydrogenedentota bacterium]